MFLECRLQDFVIDGPHHSADSLPESFRMTLAEPSEYGAFAAKVRFRAGVQDVVDGCPGSGR